MKHLLLVFLPTEDTAAHIYLGALAAQYKAISATTSEVLAIVPEQREQLARWQERVAVPFPLLADEDRQVTKKFLPEEARGGVFVTDLYGKVYYAVVVMTVDQLPAITELHCWLQAIDYQCAT